MEAVGKQKRYFLTYYKNTFRQGVPNDGDSHVETSSICVVPLGVAEMCMQGSQVQPFYFFKRPERYNQEVLSHSFSCLPLPYIEGIVLICNIDLYRVIAIFNGTSDMFNR